MIRDDFAFGDGDEPSRHIDGYFLRPVKESDLPAIVDIERDSFAAPWSKHVFMREMLLPVSQFLCAAAGDVIAGYIIYWNIDRETQLVNLAVSRLHRCRGIGRYMLEYMLADARDAGVERVFLEVRKSNAAAQNLYRSCGFVEIGVRRRYYLQEQEDAVLMQKSI